MFGFLKNQFLALYTHVTSKLQSLFGKTTVDEALFNDLERILIEADTGLAMTKVIMDDLRLQAKAGTIVTGVDLKNALKKRLLSELTRLSRPQESRIIVLVGVNGTGKTTSVAKLAYQYKNNGEKVVLVAADTFRAAAVEQLKEWAARIGVPVIAGTPGQDPAAVVYQGCAAFVAGGYDRVIVDTAGRLQNKVNLMRELEKIKRVIEKQVPGQHITLLLTIDALLGQNSRDQARLFHEATYLDGVILTKMDSTAKGGMVFAIAHEFEVPVAYIACGEGLKDLKPFDSDEYVHELIEG